MDKIPLTPKFWERYKKYYNKTEKEMNQKFVMKKIYINKKDKS